MTIGERPFQICKRCDMPHIENCETCFGFGTHTKEGKTYPIGAHRAEVLRADVKYATELSECPTCGSTVAGLPEGWEQ